MTVGLTSQIFNMIFLIKEAIKTFSRTKLGSFFTIITLIIAIFFISSSLVLFQLNKIIKETVTKNISFSVFLNEEGDKNYKQIEEEIQKLNLFEKIIYINKEEAKKKFLKDTGEDFSVILDYNPLPASLELFFAPKIIEKTDLESTKTKIETIEGIDEVIFNKSFITSALEYINKTKKYFIFAAVFFILIAIYIVYNNTRLQLEARLEEIETMKLVGAKLSTIKFPIYINSLFVGIFSTIIVTLIIYFIINYFNFSINNILTNYESLLLILFVGPVLSLLISYLALRKITLRI